MLDDIQVDVEKLVAPVVEQAGLDLIEVIVLQKQGTYQIEVLIDRPLACPPQGRLGGIGLEECADVNKKLAETFDLTQSWADNYELVVASPGLDRLLKTEKDFCRLVNQEVLVLLKEKVDGKGEYVGIVKTVAPGKVLLGCKAKDVEVPLDKILKATLNI